MIPSYQLSCCNPEHQDQIANYLCKDQQCLEKQQNPICTLCAYSTHKDHSIEPIKMILHKIHQDSASSNQNLILLAKIDVLKQKLYDTSTNITDIELRKSIKGSIDHFLSLVLKKIDKTDLKQFQTLKKENIDKKQILDSIIKYEKKYTQQNIEEEKNSKQSNYTKLLKKVIEDVEDITNIFMETVKKGQVDQFTSELFVLESGGKRYRFSSKLKHANIQLNDDNVVKMSDQYVNYNYFILCQPKLNLTKTQSITFQMVNLSSYVTIGICNLDKMAKNYEFNTGQTSHGSFQMSFDGYSWSDNNSSINSQYTGWYFNQGDKVTMQLNPKTKKLRYYKSSNPQQGYDLPVQFEKKDKMYFCVTLNSNPQQVHIVPN